MFDKIEITVSGYTMDIAPILNALVKFVKSILEVYLPEDVAGALKEFEEME